MILTTDGKRLTAIQFAKELVVGDAYLAVGRSVDDESLELWLDVDKLTLNDRRKLVKAVVRQFNRVARLLGQGELPEDHLAHFYR